MEQKGKERKPAMRQFVETALLVAVMWIPVFTAAHTQCLELNNDVNAIKNNSCTLDDLVLSHLTPAKEHLVQIVGSCQTSSAFTIIQTKTPGILVNFSSLQNRFSAPLCISFMVDVAPGNVQPFLMFYNSSFEELGTITLTRTNISVTVQESAATFLNLDTTGFHQWQLCFNGSSVELYHGCSLVDSQPFSSSAWDGVSHMTILREVFNGTTFPFLNSVSQLYLLSCSGPSVERQGMVDLQCQAHPPLNCSANTSPLSNVVSDYVMQLNNINPTPSRPLCPTTTSKSTSTANVGITTTVTTTTSVCPSSSTLPEDKKSVDVDCSRQTSEIQRLRAAISVLSVLCVVLVGALMLSILVCTLRKSK